MPRHPAQTAGLERSYKRLKDETETRFLEAMDRLLRGDPLRTDGKLTEANLCREAQRSRSTLNRYPTINTQFAEAKRNRGKASPTNLVEKVRELEETLRQVRRQDNQKMKEVKQSRDRFAQEVYILYCLIQVFLGVIEDLKARLNEASKGAHIRLVPAPTTDQVDGGDHMKVESVGGIPISLIPQKKGD